MTSRPTFADCPPEARWMAKDEDNEWFWFKFRPIAIRPLCLWMDNSGVDGSLGYFDDGSDWRKSLERKTKND